MLGDLFAAHARCMGVKERSLLTDVQKHPCVISWGLQCLRRTSLNIPERGLLWLAEDKAPSAHLGDGASNLRNFRSYQILYKAQNELFWGILRAQERPSGGRAPWGFKNSTALSQTQPSRIRVLINHLICSAFNSDSCFAKSKRALSAHKNTHGHYCTSHTVCARQQLT